MTEREAIYFGCGNGPGHYLFTRREKKIWDTHEIGHNFPWTMSHLDSGLLKNGRHEDDYDGRVFWTCGGKPELWIAFFWWDNSEDKRPGSNSGFYVRGFTLAELAEAFEYAKAVYPNVVKRQRHPLVIQNKKAST